VPSYGITIQLTVKSEDQDAGKITSAIVDRLGTLPGVRMDSVTIQRSMTQREQRIMQGFEEEEPEPSVVQKLLADVEQLKARLELREIPDVSAKTKRFIDPFDPAEAGIPDND